MEGGLGGVGGCQWGGVEKGGKIGEWVLCREGRVEGMKRARVRNSHKCERDGGEEGGKNGGGEVRDDGEGVTGRKGQSEG